MDVAANSTAADKRMETVAALIEATQFEQSALQDRCARYGVRWYGDGSGLAVNIGHFGGQPLVLALNFFKVDGQRVCFWYACSNVTHGEAARSWLDSNIGNGAIAKCDAMNFEIAISHIASLNQAAEAGRSPIPGPA